MSYSKELFVRHVVMIVLTVCCAPSLWAAKATGVFSAQQVCPAYVSKNNLTNPDNAQIQAGSDYTVLEANRPNQPDWYRVIVSSAQPRERWVSADCGQVKLTQPDTNGNAQCGVAGQADSFVLALSWQPAFCETKPDKAECAITDPQVYQARHFTLHGLWPNKRTCGIQYGFCGDVKAQKQNFCDYPQLSLTPASRAALAEVMPSVTAGSCLERHEWHKHGTCQSGSMDDYFDLAVDLIRQFNDAGMAYFMNRRIGQDVRTADFLERAAAVLGSSVRDRIKLTCQQGMLVEVQLNLNADLSRGGDLEKLIVNAPVQGNSNCGETFRVDAIGQ
ncbi:ribonuclease T [Nitrosomonas sp. JL21]|uniref:ribonuclease T2 family protein n=1 Tax=Nitrosomonas sp. JL21 TaxID=153949 RepID=UPI0013686C98|nr:ribonuclease T [Nitrosomonas sp. JL21]MBL8496401.1 ribonuclease T [Nitrosomonas sp.]MCC7090365.1 ribonuclease T [Nitrosomonas sp.]MXS77327.1 ribonuclease T [Nitrosomonas sp. JL21]